MKPNQLTCTPDNLGKIPPHDSRLEEAVLGGMLLESNTINSVLVMLEAQDFYKLENNLIFSAIQEVGKGGNKVDLLTINNYLTANGLIEQVGGTFYLAKLSNAVASSANIQFHAAIIKQLSTQRKLIQIGYELYQTAFKADTDPFKLAKVYSTQIEKLLLLRGEKTLNLANITNTEVTHLREISEREHHDGLTGIDTGFECLNLEMGGWQNSDLIILAARPGHGKTMFLLSSAVKGNVNVGIFSLEMAQNQIARRYLSMTSRIPNHKFKNASFEKYEWPMLEQAATDLTTDHDNGKSIYIDDTGGQDISDIKIKLKMWVKNQDVKICFIDYLQLIKAAGFNNREQEIAHISRELKTLAKDLNIPIIALAQLSRAVEARTEKRPMLSDLRESGSLEADADVVLFLMRPEIYFKGGDIQFRDRDGYEKQVPNIGLAWLDRAKNRHGAIGEDILKFIGANYLLTDFEEPRQFSEPARDYNDNSDIRPF